MKLERIIDKHGRQPENLIHVLLEYQQCKEDNALTEEELSRIAREMRVTESHVYSIVTFYSLFSIKPRGKYIIQVCDNVACHVNGALDVVRELEELLHIRMGETTEDGIFTVEHTSCIGCCDKPPAIRIGGELYGNITPNRLAELIATYRRRYHEQKE